MDPYKKFAEEICKNCKAEQCHVRNSSSLLYRHDGSTML